MLNWTVKNRTVWSFYSVYLQNVFTTHISCMFVKKGIWYEITNKSWYAIKLNQTKLNLA